MQIGLRTLTAREHVLSASVLASVMTMLFADFALPHASRLWSEGHPTAASVFSVLPVLVFASGLLMLLPRTGNESRIAFFRLSGRLPFLVRFVLLVLLFCGLAATIDRFAG
jgi:hypothetical protein